MADERWSEEIEERLAAHVHAWGQCGCGSSDDGDRELVRQMLGDLADAGLLIPPGSQVETRRSIQGEDEHGPWIAYEHDQSDWWLHQNDGERFEQFEITTPWRPVTEEPSRG